MLIEGNRAFEHQPTEITIGGNIVEPVIMHADVGDVRRHMLKGLGATEFQIFLLASGVVLQELHAELETLGPLGPTLGSIFTLLGKDGGTLG